LIPGFAAREVMVGALATVFAVAESDDEDETIASLGDRLRTAWPAATGFALLAWYIFAPQCLATFAVARRETNSWKWPIIMFVYMLIAAYLAALVTFQSMTWLLG
jgi:ferrous iron transport protein B